MEVELNIEGLARIYGIERLGFLTLTFADDVQDLGEASRRFNSLRGHALAGRYETWLAIVERMKSGRVHLHLVVVARQDIRTGFDFEAVGRKDYRSASEYLRGEWAFWRNAAPRYGFGRSELLPIRTDAQRFGRYLGKYLVKQFGTRRRQDAGSRLVRYAADFPRTVLGEFSPLWRETVVQGRLKVAAAWWQFPSVQALLWEFGPSWRWHLSAIIYGSDDKAWWIVNEADHCRESYGGWRFIVREAVAAWDRWQETLRRDERATRTLQGL